MSFKGGVIPALWIAAMLTTFVLVLAAQGYVPGMINSGAWTHFSSGACAASTAWEQQR